MAKNKDKGVTKNNKPKLTVKEKKEKKKQSRQKLLQYEKKPRKSGAFFIR